jgi:tetratricopeptide (TPR) repeat protein
MPEPGKCSQCGALLDDRQAQCPFCHGAGSSGLTTSRESLLLLLLALLAIGFFALTSLLATTFRRQQERLGQQWFEQGEAALHAGNAQAAIDDFRNALQFSRGDPRYHLRLIDALLAAKQTDQARAYLLTLWEQQPASGVLNLQLARLAVVRGDRPEATRYFNNAIYGVWETDPAAHRLAVRFEMAEFLLREHDEVGAQADLIALAADVPPDPKVRARVGDLFLQAGNPKRALDEFNEALRLDGKATDAQAGAGKAAFQLGSYRDAQRHLQRAVRSNPSDSDSARLLELSTLIVEADPLDASLRTKERARRAWQDYQQAMKRLQDCAQQVGEPLDVPQPETDLQALAARARQLRPRPSEATLLRDSDLVQSVSALLFQVERTTADRCGEPSGLDLALLYLARRAQESTQ